MTRLLFDAERMARRFRYLGSASEGTSVELAREAAEADLLLAGVRLSGRHHVVRIRTEGAVNAGFVLRPS